MIFRYGANSSRHTPIHRERHVQAEAETDMQQIGVQFWCVRNGRLHFSSWCCCFSFFSSWERDLQRSSLICSQCLRLRAHVFAVCLSVRLLLIPPSLSCFLSQSVVCVIMVSILSTACLQQVDPDPGPGPLNVAWGNEPANLATQWTVRDVLVVARGACMYIFGLGQMSSPYTDRKEVCANWRSLRSTIKFYLRL